ncbi:MAG: cob(I)yrinic acid a,c-diamide adenosyltransferase [Bacteroidales bacterium]|nr:cob(I)yrinic acid a,c-diamide adenosyltransferase [Bacteroidales bacterium]
MNKIYTKKGDNGETSLIGGSKVPKYHEKIEAYGTVDELNSFIGLIRDQKIDSHTKNVLIKIQNKLYTAGALLATDNKKSIKTLPQLCEYDIQTLENEIDKINKNLSELKFFILPGGHPLVSYCHIARTICRRAERITVKLSDTLNINKIIIKYLNRLSDYLFILARKFSKDLNVVETSWDTTI